VTKGGASFRAAFFARCEENALAEQARVNGHPAPRKVMISGAATRRLSTETRIQAAPR
jgi:hypothetical protein